MSDFNVNEYLTAPAPGVQWPDISHHDPKFQTLIHLERAACGVDDLIGVLLATQRDEKIIDWLHEISAHLDKVRQPLIAAAFPDRAGHA